jgi:hypothetical protein
MTSYLHANFLLLFIVTSCGANDIDKGSHNKPNQNTQSSSIQQSSSHGQEFQAISAFAQLIIGLGQLFLKPTEGSVQQGVQNVANAAANFYHLTQKYSVDSTDAGEITRTLINNMTDSERSELVANIQKAFYEIRNTTSE